MAVVAHGRCAPGEIARTAAELKKHVVYSTYSNGQCHSMNGIMSSDPWPSAVNPRHSGTDDRRR